MLNFVYENIYRILEFFLPNSFLIKEIIFVFSGLIIAFIIINAVLVGVLILIWGERRLLGRFQQRSGPNRWGPRGILVSTGISEFFVES